jgi:peptidoglycan-associated lipoprotein
MKKNPSHNRISWALFATLTVTALTACPPKYPKCENDENCKEAGEVCVQGQCVECAINGNCKPGFVCDANKCVPKPECGKDTDCKDGKKCSAGKCVVAQSRNPDEIPCSVDDECPSGMGCKGGKCAKVDVSGAACTFEPLRFGFNDFNLSADSQAVLGKYAECIKKQSLRMTLEGHADERGTEEFNMVLSQKRAASVRKYLLDLGVTGGALDSVGFGENKPATGGSDEGSWATNRRVEFKQR